MLKIINSNVKEEKGNSKLPLVYPEEYKDITEPIIEKEKPIIQRLNLNALINQYTKLKSKFILTQESLAAVSSNLAIKRFSYKEFSSIYKQIKGDYIDANKNTMLNFNCKNNEFRKLIEVYKEKTIPVTLKIGVLNILYGFHEDICMFLEKSIPQEQQELWFNYCSPLIVGTTFIESLCSAVSKVTRYFGVYQTKLENHEFVRLLEASSHCEEVAFVECDLDTDEEPDFSCIKKSNVKKIWLTSSGQFAYSDWTTSVNKFENIIKAISKSKPLKLSLTEIDIWDCCIDDSEVDEIMKKHGLDHIQIQNKLFERD